MQIAIDTGSWSASTKEALEHAADLGFVHVELKLQAAEFGYGYRRKANVRFYRQLRQQIDRLGLTVWSVVSPEPTQEQMFSPRARKEILSGGAGAAGILGSRVYVVRPADLFSGEDAFLAYAQNEGAPPVVDGFDEAWVQTVNRRMTMALINQDYWLGTPLTNHAERLEKILEHLAIGCALDVPRALSRSALAHWIECVGNRLATAYAYDLDDEGKVAAPSTEEWLSRLAALGKSRLKCIVLRPGPNQNDAEILMSRKLLQEGTSKR